MSRIGKLEIKIPDKTKIEYKDKVVYVKGPLGEMSQKITGDIDIIIEDGSVKVNRGSDEKQVRALHGLYRSLINNMVIGVTAGFKKELVIEGVGYKVSLKETKATKEAGIQIIKLQLGLSHMIEFIVPKGIIAEIKGNVIALTGQDKQLVGEIAARIRRLKEPEPYKGKGIRYSDEKIKRKVGKATK